MAGTGNSEIADSAISISRAVLLTNGVVSLMRKTILLMTGLIFLINSVISLMRRGTLFVSETASPISEAAFLISKTTEKGFCVSFFDTFQP